MTTDTDDPAFGTVEGTITCGACDAPEDSLTAEFTENGQYKWSRCDQCGGKNLSNGLVWFGGESDE